MPMSSQHKLFELLSQTRLDALLYRIAEAIRSIFASDQAYLSMPLHGVGRGETKSVDLLLTAWGLSDLAYHAVCHGSDSRSGVPTLSDLAILCNELVGLDEDLSNQQIGNLAAAESTIKFAVGHSQKQFWYQNKGSIRAEFNRQVELLEVLPTVMKLPMDLDDDCQQATGWPLRSFRTLLWALYAIAGQRSNVTKLTIPDELKRLHPVLTAENLQAIVALYSANYQEVRDAPLKENYLFLKPIIETSGKSLIAVNQFMIAKKTADGPFWAIRDLYLRRKSAAFANEFGRLFEKYVEKLLGTYLAPDRYFRIPEGDVKLADWIVQGKRYRYIVEQKTAIASLEIKRQYPDMDRVRGYLSRLEDGVLQLDSTERQYHEDVDTVKLLLLYETFYFSDAILRPVVVRGIRDRLQSERSIHFIDIDEFEWFVEILGKEPEKADSIIDKKRELESVGLGSGIEFWQVIPKVVTSKKEYIYSRLDHWDKYIQEPSRTP